jgi:acyl dehydratase
MVLDWTLSQLGLAVDEVRTTRIYVELMRHDNPVAAFDNIRGGISVDLVAKRVQCTVRTSDLFIGVYETWITVVKQNTQEFRDFTHKLIVFKA